MDLFNAIATSMFVLSQSLVASNTTSKVCDDLRNPPTVSSCWDCFQNLLSDCDKRNPQGERRDACYKGANNFYTWCLGRISPTKTSAIISAPKTFDKGAGLAFRIDFTTAVDPDTIEVLVRTVDNDTFDSQIAKSYTSTISATSIDVLVDTAQAEGTVVGFVVRLKDTTFAQAFAVEEVLPGDFDNDGQVTDLDIAELWDQYGAGKISYEDFIEKLGSH